MKLHFKLALIGAISKIILFLIFLVLLGRYIDIVAFNHTDKNLIKMKDKTMSIINKIGIKSFLVAGQDSSYASYNILKDEYITLELDTIDKPGQQTFSNEVRVIEGDEFDYRILNCTFKIDNHVYSLEVGRNIQLIYALHKTIKTISIRVILLFLVITILFDIGIFNYLLRPLNKKIIPKLKTITNPETFQYSEVQTSTYDFVYLNNAINELMLKISTALKNQKKFIANVAHELFTPITVMQNKLENLISSGKLTRPMTTSVVELQNQLNRLNQIIKALLLISRIENDQYPKGDTFAIHEIVEEIFTNIEDRAQIKGITMENQIDKSTSLVNVNKSLLYILIFNLVNNAIKYNYERGKILVRCSQTNSNLKIEVIDTGIGIDPQQLPFIFDRFKRVDGSGSEGFGLGLSIVNTIANFHGASVEVSSELKKGSTFSVIFPLKFVK
jgi:two-component system, OmpR family, sensor histidine kinase ArlS